MWGARWSQLKIKNVASPLKVQDNYLDLKGISFDFIK